MGRLNFKDKFAHGVIMTTCIQTKMTKIEIGSSRDIQSIQLANISIIAQCGTPDVIHFDTERSMKHIAKVEQENLQNDLS